MFGNHTQYSDNHIVEIIANGNRIECNKVLKFLYREHFRMVSTMVLKNKGDEEESKDVFQDALIIFYDQVRKGKFRGNSSIGTYLYSVAKNVWIAIVKKKRKAILLKLEDIQFVDDISIETILSEQYSNDLFATLFQQLNEGCKTILSLSFYQDLSVDEIKRKLQLGSEQAVRTKKFRCLQKLKTLFIEKNISKDQFVV